MYHSGDSSGVVESPGKPPPHTVGTLRDNRRRARPPSVHVVHITLANAAGRVGARRVALYLTAEPENIERPGLP